MRRGLLALLAAVLLLSACGGGTAEPDHALALLERWLRLGEDANASVQVYEGMLPPDLAGLLNPGVDVTAEGADLVAIPVHPDGTLLGSFEIRRAEGTHLVWLIFDLAADQGATLDVVGRQLDETPWQVVSQQADRSLAVLQFQSTVSADLTGTAVIQPNPSADSYEVVIRRDGGEVTLSVPRGAPVPIIDAELDAGLKVTRTNPGEAARAGLREGDVIVRVAGTDVKDADSLAAALEALARGDTPSTGLTYILEIKPAVSPEEPAFVMPPAQTLPGRFPAIEVWQPYTVLDFQWFTSPQGSFYQSSMVTSEGPTAAATEVRDGLEAAGWEITGDRPVGFATVLDISHSTDGLAGQVSVDTFPPDESLTLIFVQIQTATSPGN